MVRVALAVALCTPASAAGQSDSASVRLSLAESIRRAESSAEQIEVARAEVRRARAEESRATSALLPRVDLSASYSRTLASQFRDAFQAPSGGSAPQGCPDYTPDPQLPLAARVDSLEQAASCGFGSSGGGLGGADFGELGFGSENTYNLGLSVSWDVFGGGRLRALGRSAEAVGQGAEVALGSARAQLVLDVTRAYFDAQLAQRLLDIARATLAQAEATVVQTVEQERAGAQAEFEVLRARVERANQRPAVIRRRTERDLAVFRLKQLVGLDLETSVTLTDSLEQIEPAERVGLPGRPRTAARAPVLEAAAQVDAQEAQVDAARDQRLPGVSLTSSYGRVAYPGDLTPAWGQFRTNWTVGFTLQMPLWAGGRIGADVNAAQATLAQARARLERAREQADLDTYAAYAELDAALAAWEASAGAVEQAERAYEIADIRYREGLSTQLELSDARLLLQQALANRARAARDVKVARTRVRVLPDLPVVGGTAAGGEGAMGAVPPGRGGSPGP